MTIYIVEDDRFFNRFLEKTLTLLPDIEVETFENGKDFLSALKYNPDIVTLDYGLPDYDGDYLMRQIKYFNPGIQVVVISGQDDISTAVNLLKEGAYDYITKDDNLKEHLLNTIQNLKSHLSLQNEVDFLRTEVSKKYDFSRSIIGDSPVMKDVFSLIEKSIKINNITVSVSGETGTGKELIAKTIHYNSRRKDKPFVAVNMGAIPKDLIESELFGHEKGAFTGAIGQKKGKFEEANGGTIFLDEIAEMDFNLQVKLLRVIQEKEITRIGGNNVIKIDTRVITATNKDLMEEVKSGNFREDLYYRLFGLPIHLPPLKQRDSDILKLSRYFLDEFCKENDLPKMELTAEARKTLLDYHFPGNVRELKAIIELAAVMTSNDKIDNEHLNIQGPQDDLDVLSEGLTLKDYNDRIINHYLRKNNHNVVVTAQKLGIGKSTIYNMLKEKKEFSQ